MVPKAFPFAFNVGTDLCSVHRIADLLRQRHVRDRFVRRISTRLEWAQIWRFFQWVSLTQQNIHSDIIASKDCDSRAIEEVFGATASYSKANSTTWTLPDISNPYNAFGSPEAFDCAVKEGASPLAALLRHLGGRFATASVLTVKPC